MSEDLAQDIIRTTIIGIVLFIGVAIAAFMWLMVEVNARDLGQWENTDPAIKKWFQTLQQPDNPPMSCCGEADAYYCDILGTEAEKNEGGTRVSNFCLITDDRDDAPLKRPHMDIGTKIYIPNHKMKWSENDPQPRKDWTTGEPVELNPTGHSMVFLSREGFVYCFVMAGGV